MNIKEGLYILLIIVCINKASAQDSSKNFFTTGVGLIKVQGALGSVFHSSVAFNSGIEIGFKKNWFVQAELGFNSLKYDQQVKDNNSPFLFQHTNSSLFLLGGNIGKNIYLSHPKWFASVYMGGGYLNIGEPRIKLDDNTGIVTQTATRKNSLFGKAGGRLAFRTNSAFFQTLYLDGSWWGSPVSIQDHRLNSLSFFIGSRMSIGSN